MQLAVHLMLHVPTLVQSADELSPSWAEQSRELKQRKSLAAPASTKQESTEVHRAEQLSPQRASQLAPDLQLKLQSSTQVAEHRSPKPRQVG